MVDTNVLIDLQADGGGWRDWSRAAIVDARLRGRVAVSAVVAGELAAQGGTLQQIEGFVRDLGLMIEPLTAAGAIEAGQAHRAYRQAGGTRTHLLGDFLVGGHATAADAAFITRDPRRYRCYFPSLVLITPETDND